MSNEGETTGFWITPATDREDETATDLIQRLVGNARLWGFRKGSSGTAQISVEDWMCFYASGQGVVAHAQVASALTEKRRTELADEFGVSCDLTQVSLYLDNPVVIDRDCRSQMDRFDDPDKQWGWLVFRTSRLSESDFRRITRS